MCSQIGDGGLKNPLADDLKLRANRMTRAIGQEGFCTFTAVPKALKQRIYLLRKWFVGGSPILECDSQHHLGILRTVSPSSILRTTERCSSGRSAFFLIKCCWL